MTDRRAVLLEIARAGGDGTVSVPAAWLREALDAPVAPVVDVDLTVAQVAALFARANGRSRSASTVRAWLEAGLLQGYKLRGKEWRVPPAAVAAFQARERVKQPRQEENMQDPTDLSAWRRLRRSKGAG